MKNKKITNFSYSNRKDKERGVAMAELAVTLPLLVLFLNGLVNAGNLLGNVIFVNQIAYSSVLIGSQQLTGSRYETMRTRASDVRDISLNGLGRNRPLENQDNLTISNPGVSGAAYTESATDAQDRIVSVKVSGGVRQIIAGFFGDNVSQQITAPMLIPRTTVHGGWSQFSDP